MCVLELWMQTILEQRPHSEQTIGKKAQPECHYTHGKRQPVESASSQLFPTELIAKCIVSCDTIWIGRGEQQGKKKKGTVPSSLATSC